ncbi:hypothetical protein LTS18_009986 [Coniosporium uncinatum]|uniref:Uncharacterized protein n=1 Tax=Coniosporium uncinatum TaxID=93489 RepID=A0ACC3DC26_9PEZI|nr:hypothetical protein LTS18_009986 [Coniosporium uncinatum]
MTNEATIEREPDINTPDTMSQNHNIMNANLPKDTSKASSLSINSASHRSSHSVSQSKPACPRLAQSTNRNKDRPEVSLPFTQSLPQSHLFGPRASLPGSTRQVCAPTLEGYMRHFLNAHPMASWKSAEQWAKEQLEAWDPEDPYKLYVGETPEQRRARLEGRSWVREIGERKAERLREEGRGMRVGGRTDEMGKGARRREGVLE